MPFISAKALKLHRFPWIRSLAKVIPGLFLSARNKESAFQKRISLGIENLESRLTPVGGFQNFTLDQRPTPVPFLFTEADPGTASVVSGYYALNNQRAFEVSVMSSGFTGGVRVATGDINHDGIPDLIASAGPSGGPRVQVLDGKTGAQLSGANGSFYAYDSSFSGGVQIASADVDGDGYDDIITGPGVGGGPNIKIFSGYDNSVLASFYAFDSSFTGGTTVATGDFNQDGHLDLVVGAGVGGGPHVKIFDLSNLSSIQTITGPLGSFYAFDSSFTGGVTLGTNPAFADLTGDGIPDVLVAQGPGTGSLVRVIDGASGSVATEFSPFGQSVSGGIRVATGLVNNDSIPDIVVGKVSGVSSNPLVFSGETFSQFTSLESGSVTPLGSVAAAGGAGSGVGGGIGSGPIGGGSITVTGSGTVGGVISLAMQVNAGSSGVAPQGFVTLTINYPAAAMTYTYDVNLSASGTQGIATFPITAAFSGSMIISGQYYSSNGYDSGSITGTTITINNSGTMPAPGGTNDLVGSGSPQIRQFIDPFLMDDPNPAGYQGYWMYSNNDLPGNGLLGLNRTWSNNPNFASGAAGSGSTISDLPYLKATSSSSLYQLVVNSAKAYEIDYVSGAYTTRFKIPFKITSNSNNELVLATDSGKVFTFYDFSTSVPAAKRGTFKSMLDEGGNLTSVQSWDSAGRISEITTVNVTSSPSVTESVLYGYVASGVNSGLLSSAFLRRKVGTGSYSTVMTASYAYYDGTTNNGAANDLKSVLIQNASNATVDNQYYRYYTSNSTTGYIHGLKYALGLESYKRITNDLGDPDSQNDSSLAPYADHFFEYNSDKKITKHTLAGFGNSTASTVGLGTFTYTYDVNTKSNIGLNIWKFKMEETNPEGGITTTYSNSAGQPMLSVFKESTTSTNKWITYNHYDPNGRIDLQTSPAGVSGYQESLGDLVGYTSLTNATYLKDAEGLTTLFTYYKDNTATATQAGSADGYIKLVSIRQGENLSSEAFKNSYDYFYHLGNNVSTFIYANSYLYTDNSTKLTTSTAYNSWITYTVSGPVPIESAQAKMVTTTLPPITSLQNGDGNFTGPSMSVVYDSYGRPIWYKDAGGYLAYAQYDAATMAITKSILDVNTAQSSDFSNLPDGWSNPGGGGTQTKTTMEVDAYGRATKATDAKGNVSYAVYNDNNYEARFYAGWNSSTNTPTGPISLIRMDLSRGYSEALTYSATPTVTGGRPTGQETVTGITSLARSYTNIAGQVTYSDSYFDLTGLTYSNTTNLGTEGVHFLRGRYAYDDYGRQNRSQSPAGTIIRLVYDKLGRASSTWIGLDDTPISGTWSQTNTSGTDLIKTLDAEYDSGTPGDSNLTRITEYPGGGATNRVTQIWYDWRDRAVVAKGGVESSESTSTNRSIIKLNYDNLNQVFKTQTYDGDGVTPASGFGTWSIPSGTLLTSQSDTNYDNLGQVYQTKSYSVDPANGAVGNALTSNFWYDPRGNLIKDQEPGGLVSKATYDGLSRVSKSYLTDGGSDYSYSDAGNVSGDTVFTQSEITYDANSNPILVATKERFHNATSTGDLVAGMTGYSSFMNNSRAYYSAAYYDSLDRVTSSVDVGTNGGATYSRPSTVPTRSDTVHVTDYGYNTTSGLLDTVTDPRGIVDKSYFDAMGRTSKTIEAFDGGAITGTTNKTTEFAYDSYGHLSSLKAYRASGDYAQTQYIYGVTTSASGINSNDILSAVRYPDKTTGNASASIQENYTVNALGEVKSATDRLGTTHSYSYDVLGRVTSDAITTLGSGLDGSIRRIDTAYDPQGNPYLFTSYSAASGGTIVNQVQDKFNGFGQLINEYQSHSGAVNTASTPKVGYTYTEGTGNQSRQTGMVYPNGRNLTYDYGTSGSTNERISRLEAIKDGTTVLESYQYLGLDQAVIRSHPQPGIDLTYVKQSGESNGDAGDQYTGLNRFGQIVDQRWIKTSTGTATDRFQYSYDRDGNVLYKNNLVLPTRSELYHANGSTAGYDNLNQLTAFARGTLSDTNSDGVPDTIATNSQSQSWTTDGQGNFTSITTNGTTQTRTYDKQNEITAVGSSNLTYDAAGNLKSDEQNRYYTYDGWGQLIAVSVPNNASSIQASYTYDALGHRITETSGGVTRDLYYSGGWQLIEERTSNVAQVQYVWSPVYVDQMIERDRNADGNSSTGPNGMEERLYVQTDANFNVTAITDASGNVLERYQYDPYGKVTVLVPVAIPFGGGAGDGWGGAGNTQYAWQYFHQGGRQDTATGLLNFRNRDYSTSLMRWTTNDPIGFGGGDTNTYRYVGNGPGNGLDPSGLQKAPNVPNDNGSKSQISEINYTPPGIENPIEENQGGNEGWSLRKTTLLTCKWIVSTAYGFTPLGMVENTRKQALEAVNRSSMAYTAITQTGGSKAEGIYYAGALILADMTGVTTFEDGRTGRELFTNRELSLWEARTNMAIGGIQMLTTALGGGGIAGSLGSRFLPKTSFLNTQIKLPNLFCNRWWPGCFFQGTLVVTSHGATSIEQIKVGDKVMAFDLEKGTWKPTEVINTFQSDFRGFKTTVRCGGESIEATSNHPFWVIQGEDLENRPWPEEMPELPEHVSLAGRWVDAASLRPGDMVQLVTGQQVPVEAVTSVAIAEKVFNLEVSEIHTYAVGKIGILVHNNNCPIEKGTRRNVASKEISNVPGDDFVPNPSVSNPYSRPRGAGPTAAQRAAVQGKPCVDCGKVTPKQVADHIDPLSVQHYRDGAVDVAKQSKLDAVQSHCPVCSAKQGGLLSAFSKRMKALLGG